MSSNPARKSLRAREQMKTRAVATLHRRGMSAEQITRHVNKELLRQLKLKGGLPG